MAVITVKELIEFLEDQVQDAPVAFACPSHDYWGNTIVDSVSTTSLCSVKWSEYHGNHILCKPDDKEAETVFVVLSSSQQLLDEYEVED